MLGNFSEEEEYILAIALEKLNNFFEEKYEGIKQKNKIIKNEKNISEFLDDLKNGKLKKTIF